MADLIVSSASNVSDSDICMACGACCATYRVSFYWAEADALGIPEVMTGKVNDFYSCMKGTNQCNPRCIALGGTIGQQVACQIYPIRPGACHTVKVGDEQCQKARHRHGLPNMIFDSESKFD